MKQLIHREDLHHGGFAGLREHRIVMHSDIFVHHKEPDTVDGIGSFIYLADAKFNPHGQTHMHPHKEVDVISVMVEGNIKHEGSLEHGSSLKAGDIQVQRAGGEGFSHNEINPDATQNRMLQLWFAPETSGEKASYQLFNKSQEKVQRIYGGDDGSTLKSDTIMKVIRLQDQESYHYQGLFQAYLFKGTAHTSNSTLIEGDFFSDDTLDIQASGVCELILIHLKN